MDASRLVEMINLLIKRSKEGDLEWKSKRTLMGDGYACVVAGMQVMVMRHGPISTLGGARITVTTAEGLEIVSAAEGDFITGNAGGGECTNDSGSVGRRDWPVIRSGALISEQVKCCD